MKSDSLYVDLHHVRKCFGKDEILKQLDFQMIRGQVYGIIGNNGSGKTVLMKCICGFLPVTEGTVMVGGKYIGKEIDFPESLGVIIETPGFLASLSGRRNLEILAGLRGNLTGADITAILHRVGLDPDLKKPVAKYSLGMRQRLGIAQAMAEEGAYVVIADMNEAGALATAVALCEKYGEGAAMAVGANVSDEQSVSDMIDKTVLAYGGLDIFVNNAGIVRAGSLEEMTKSNFELVTAVNYTAYFLCAKYASVPMKRQREYAPARMSDIIEINSKSGLAGSNKNFAYAGSKFGGIGLTQSFALELAPYGIKVNAICPGNYLDGPLWTDPERGLFVQYLKAGKVPGAKTVEDVKKYYESKVPLGRGCLPEDIARALFYIVEQKYETGQALPVTGGQEMLK